MSGQFHWNEVTQNKPVTQSCLRTHKNNNIVITTSLSPSSWEFPITALAMSHPFCLLKQQCRHIIRIVQVPNGNQFRPSSCFTEFSLQIAPHTVRLCPVNPLYLVRILHICSFPSRYQARGPTHLNSKCVPGLGLRSTDKWNGIFVNGYVHTPWEQSSKIQLVTQNGMLHDAVTESIVYCYTVIACSPVMTNLNRNNMTVIS